MLSVGKRMERRMATASEDRGVEEAIVLYISKRERDSRDESIVKSRVIRASGLVVSQWGCRKQRPVEHQAVTGTPSRALACPLTRAPSGGGVEFGSGLSCRPWSSYELGSDTKVGAEVGKKRAVAPDPSPWWPPPAALYTRTRTAPA